MDSSAPRRVIGRALLLAGLAAGFTLLNPYWFGDAPFYARHIARGLGATPLDAGHLLWQPLGAVARALLWRLGLPLDPLRVLRLLSGAATALACLACFALAGRLTGSRRDAWVAAALVAVSNLCLSYGGSGCSYTAAMGAGAAAFLLLLGRGEREWGVGRGAAAAGTLGLAWALWGTSLLLIPGLATTAVLASSGSGPRRLARGVVFAAACLGVVVAAAYLANHVFTSERVRLDDRTWIRNGTHGRPLHYEPLNVLRAGYGLNVVFVHLGPLGRTIKQSLLDGTPPARLGESAAGIAVALVLLAVLAAGFWALLGRARRGDAGGARWLGPVALATVAPIAVFAAGWNGADIERFSLALPMLACVVAYGACDVIAPALRAGGAAATRLGLACVMCVALVNVLGWVVPRRVAGGGLTMTLGRIARQHLPAGSMLVVAGHEFPGNVTYAAAYFYDIDVYNVTYEAAVHGTEDYAERLRSAVSETLAGGGRVAIVSDLAGEPTPGGIGFIAREQPDVRIEDLASSFSRWPRGRRWQADRFTLVEVSPPRSGEGAPAAAGR